MQHALCNLLLDLLKALVHADHAVPATVSSIHVYVHNPQLQETESQLQTNSNMHHAEAG